MQTATFRGVHKQSQSKASGNSLAHQNTRCPIQPGRMRPPYTCICGLQQVFDC